MIEPETQRPGAGQRTLAAIVFTDAVDFSARVTEDEGAALKAVRRDLALMSDVCRQFDGQVVKNTGDGLMMLFASAVRAEHCAIEIGTPIFASGARSRRRPSCPAFTDSLDLSSARLTFAG